MEQSSGQPASRADLNQLRDNLTREISALRKASASKDELKAAIHRFAIEQIRMRKDMMDMERKLTSQMSEGFNRIYNVVDSCMSRLEQYDRESARFPHSLDLHGRQLADHEKRITDLETKH